MLASYFTFPLAALLFLSALAFNNRHSGYITMIKVLVWKLRALLHNHPVPQNLDLWEYTPTNDRVVRKYDRQRVWGFWLFLQPFFDLHGYRLFEPRDEKWSNLVPAQEPTSQTRGRNNSQYPFARKFYEKDTDIQFTSSVPPIFCFNELYHRSNHRFQSLRVWPARDHNRDDVVIRLISGAEPSEELKVWQRLHSPALKNHPRNRSIPVLGYLTFDRLTFIVMPRWGCSIDHDFATTEEVFYFADCILDFVDFLHENRIVHRDLTDTNTCINVISKVGEWFVEGRCNPKDALYAVLDFGHSVAYPLESNLDEITTTLCYGTELKPHGERNPFKLEMYWVGRMLQRHVRVVEEFIPEIAPYFDNIIEADEAHRPSAKEALEQFRQLQASLSVEQLQKPLKYRFWKEGRLIPK
ncbi:hypothetical protein BJ165DRAFT_1509985 [Panaeolus papilionaceus]|nr:hypothetical protein BJ165DRAFT_1509985 [Panaeolus papilionaceus]